MDYISRKQLKKVKNPPGFFRLKNPARAGKWVGTRVPTHDNPEPSARVLADLKWWSLEENVLKGVKLGTPVPATLLYTDASLEG